MSDNLVSVNFQGTVETHITSIIPSYATLCGLVGDCDDQELVPVRNAEINCHDCLAIWHQCSNFSYVQNEKVLVPVKPRVEELGQVTSGVEGRSGWILPDGKFYTCGTMQHDALAEALGYDVPDIEDRWIRVAHPTDTGIPTSIASAFHLGTRSRAPSKKQINFMWDWCLYHKIPYPKDDLERLG